MLYQLWRREQMVVATPSDSSSYLMYVKCLWWMSWSSISNFSECFVLCVPSSFSSSVMSRSTIGFHIGISGIALHHRAAHSGWISVPQSRVDIWWLIGVYDDKCRGALELFSSIPFCWLKYFVPDVCFCLLEIDGLDGEWESSISMHDTRDMLSHYHFPTASSWFDASGLGPGDDIHQVNLVMETNNPGPATGWWGNRRTVRCLAWITSGVSS